MTEIEGRGLDLRIQFLEHVGRLMAKQHVTPVVLAHRIGWTQCALEQMLDGEVDLDLCSMADIGWALDVRWGMRARVDGMTDEERLGRVDPFQCPCCGQTAIRAYRLGDREVCGFCRGIGADGMLTDTHGIHP